MRNWRLTFGTLAWAVMICAVALGPDVAAAADCANLVGEWENDFGSSLDIQSVDPATGAVRGRYLLGSGAGGWFPLTGWANSGSGGRNTVAKVLAFSVRWGDAGSITSWIGTCEVEAGESEISTILQMARPSTEHQWDHLVTNAEVFRPK